MNNEAAKREGFLVYDAYVDGERYVGEGSTLFIRFTPGSTYSGFGSVQLASRCAPSSDPYLRDSYYHRSDTALT